MPRPKAPLPKIRFHLSGNAIVTICGRDYYLGKHGSPVSFARYAILIRDYQANGMTAPPDISSSELVSLTEGFESGLPTVHLEDEPITIKHLMASYNAHAETVYETSPAEQSRIKQICDEIELHEGSTIVAKYGPKKLKDQRDRWVKSGKCRKYCNRLTCLVVRIFGWGVSEELVDETTWRALMSVTPLREGKTAAPESDARVPVSLDDVRKTIPELSPMLRAMVRIHVATGMRPTELCTIRPMDIDKAGPEWLYKPPHHKNKSKGQDRVIPILGDAKDALIDYMNRAADSYCFCPSESVAQWQAKKRSNRRSKVQPSQEDRSKENPLVQPGDRYTQDSYRRAIHRACKRAGVKQWFPYQLRHLNLTEVRDALSAEHAQAIGGHSRIDMTNVYAKAKVEKAIEAAKHAPMLGVGQL